MFPVGPPCIYITEQQQDCAVRELLGHPGPCRREEGSQMELLRLAASNPDSELQKVNFSVTMGEI